MCKVKVASSSENTPFSQKTFVQGPDAPLHIRNNESTSYTHQSDRELPANSNMHLHGATKDRIKNFLRFKSYLSSQWSFIQGIFYVRH